MMGYGSGPGGGMFYGLLMMLGLILLVVVAIRASGGGRPRGGSRRGYGDTDKLRRAAGQPEPRARALLAERYARGDLSTEEYQERLRVLEQRHR